MPCKSANGHDSPTGENNLIHLVIVLAEKKSVGIIASSSGDDSTEHANRIEFLILSLFRHNLSR